MSAPQQTIPSWIQEHTKLYQTDPEKAHMWDSSLGSGKPTGPVATLLLTVKGRKSGTPQATPLIYGKTEGGFAVIASKGGAPAHPAWYLNLAANPDVELQVGPTHFRARARTASPEERRKIWAQMVKIYAPYDDYQTRAGREIPVVILEPKS